MQTNLKHTRTMTKEEELAQQMQKEQAAAAAAEAPEAPEQGGEPAEGAEGNTDVPEVPEQNGASEEETPRSKFKKFYGERKPDLNMEDEEALFGSLNDDYAEYDRMKRGEDRLNEMMDEDEDFARFLKGIAKKEGFIASLYNTLGDRIIEAAKDPEARKMLEEEHKKKLEAEAKNKKLNDEFDDNILNSVKRMREIAEKEGVDDETVQKAFKLYDDLYEEYITGDYKEETLRLLLKGINYDKAVEDAEKAGRVEGANQRHVEELRKPKRTTDGVTTLGSGQGGHSAPSFLSGNKDSGANDIYSRGGYTRTKRG